MYSHTYLKFNSFFSSICLFELKLNVQPSDFAISIDDFRVFFFFEQKKIKSLKLKKNIAC